VSHVSALVEGLKAKGVRAGGRVRVGDAEAVLRGSPIPVFLMRMTEAALESAAPEKRI
jgi:hypothetical protein